MGARLSNRKVQVVIVCMLVGVVVYNVLHFTGRKPRRRNLVYEEAGVEIDVGGGATPNWATGVYESAASWDRNPFTGDRIVHAATAVQPVTPQATAVTGIKATGSGVKITGVMISGDKKYVLAGDVLLREGERLGAGRIKLINRDSVVVEYDTGTKTIYIE